jgi:hypothetical protein
MIFKTPYRKLKIQQHDPHLKPEVYACAPEGYAVMAPLVTPVVFTLTLSI